MGHFYDNSIIPQHLRRDFDVYERLEKLRLDLGTFESWINRDLKGANVMVGGDGLRTVKIIDFGLAARAPGR